MRRFIAAAALLIAPSLFAHTQTVNIDKEDDEELTSCSQLRITFDNVPGLRAEDELPVGSLRSLKIDSVKRGAVRVLGWDEPRYRVTACRAADSSATLAATRGHLSGNTVTTDGPENSEQWFVYLIVRTPRNAQLDVESLNGPITLHSVNGRLNLHATNGPITIKDSTGTIDARTVNGPLSIAGGSGNVKMAATNGPLTVKLRGSRWDGTLSGTTQNGPLSLKIPRNFGSGVEVTASGRGPISCRAEACGNSRRSWRDDDDAPRRLSLGSGAHNVTLSTVNGPVVVKEQD